jgi:hypothetical protein
MRLENRPAVRNFPAGVITSTAVLWAMEMIGDRPWRVVPRTRAIRVSWT